MKFVLAFSALLWLTNCSGFKLPQPGEPVRKDIDEQWRQREERLPPPDTQANPYASPQQQSAYESGYAAGYLARQRGQIADPEPQARRLKAANRDAYTSGYHAGYAR